MGLFKPAWMGKDEAKAMRALDKVSDDATLFQIAAECPHASVQRRAIEKIQNNDVRLNVDPSRTSKNVSPMMRQAALDRATERQLYDIAMMRNPNMNSWLLDAVKRITDETLLARIAANERDGLGPEATLRAAAFAKVNDRELLLQLMDQYRDVYTGDVDYGQAHTESYQRSRAAGGKIIREAVEEAYNRMERPPLEWSLLVQNDKAYESIMLDLDEMSMPEDRDRIMAVLTTQAFDKPLKQKAARLLPDDDPALDERCCPFCGAIDSIHGKSNWSDYWDRYIYILECDVCKRRDSGGDLDPKDFSVALRELRDM